MIHNTNVDAHILTLKNTHKLTFMSTFERLNQQILEIDEITTALGHLNTLLLTGTSPPTTKRIIEPVKC